MNDELQQKMEKLQALHNAAEEARRVFRADPRYATASAYQMRKKEIEAFRRTLPKPKLAYDASDL